MVGIGILFIFYGMSKGFSWNLKKEKITMKKDLSIKPHLGWTKNRQRKKALYKGKSYI